MPIHSNASLIPAGLPGLAHRTLAGPQHGLRELEVWSQSIDPQAATPPHRHDCEEVVVVMEGRGTLDLEGTALPFAAGDTVVIPRNALHQILNTGDAPLRLLAAFSMAPVDARFPDGSRIDLPWHHPAFEAAAHAA